MAYQGQRTLRLRASVHIPDMELNGIAVMPGTAGPSFSSSAIHTQIEKNVIGTPASSERDKDTTSPLQKEPWMMHLLHKIKRNHGKRMNLKHPSPGRSPRPSSCLLQKLLKKRQQIFAPNSQLLQQYVKERILQID